MKPLDALRWTFFLVAFGALLAACFFAVKDAVGTFHYLRSLGWTEYLEIGNPNPALFMIQCNADRDCRSIFFQHYRNESLSLPTILLTLLFFTSLFAAAITRVVQGGPKHKDPGGSKFASDKDLEKYLKDDKEDSVSNPRVAYLGFTESGKAIKPRMRDRCTHVAIFAGTGGGKTTRIIKPSLIADAEDGVSVLMVDPKWPDPQGGYSDLLAVFSAKGYDMQVFCPFNENTMHLPLLSGVKTREDASALATMIVPRQDSSESSEGVQYYKNLERRLLLLLIQAAVLENNHSMAALYRRLEVGPKALKEWVSNIPDETLKLSFEALLELRQDSLIGVMQGLMSSLEIFTDPRLDAATQASPHGWKNLNPNALVEKKAALYVGIPNYLILRGEGKLLLSLFFRHIMNGLMALAEKSGGTLPRHVAVYIDEFAHIGRIDQAANWFGTMRSYKIGFTVAMQNRAQLELVYGTLAAKALSGGNFQHLITFPSSLTGDDKEYISDLLGEVTVLETTKGRSWHHIFEMPRKTVTDKLVPRALVSREEMNSWPEDVGILDPHGAPPTKIVAPRINQKKALKVKNPFYRYGKDLENIDALHLVQAVLNRRRYNWMTTPLSKDTLDQQRQQPTPDPALAPDFSLPPNPETLVEDKPKAAQEAAIKPTPVEQPKEAISQVEVAKPEARKSKKSKLPKSPPSPQRPHITRDQENVPQGELIQAFRAWISNLRWKQVPITVYTVRAGGQDRVSKVLFEALPGALRHEYLALWKRRKWVQVRHEKFGIVGVGTSVLCKNQIQSFMDAANSQIIDVGQDNERVIVKARKEKVPPMAETDQKPAREESVPESTPVTPAVAASTAINPEIKQALMTWFETNQLYCSNTFLHEQLKRIGQPPKVNGFLQYQRFLLRQDVARELMDEASTALPVTVLENNGKSYTFVSLSGDLALRLAPVKAWLETHRDDLRPFSDEVLPDVQETDLAFYQPTMLGLTKTSLNQIIKAHPEFGSLLTKHQQEWRPSISGSRPRLLRYVVQDAFVS